MSKNTTVPIVYYYHKKVMCREVNPVLSKGDKFSRVFAAFDQNFHICIRRTLLR
jgi:hypothetical protein